MSDDKLLSDLWNSRGEGDPKKLEALYRVIEKNLRNYTKPFMRLDGLDGLSDAQRKKQYINDFFVDKVLSGGMDTRCDHVGALKAFYTRYIEDVARRYQKHKKREISDFIKSGDEADEEINLIDTLIHQQWKDIAHEENSENPGALSALNELGITEAAVVAEFQKIIEAHNNPDKYWVILFMGYHYCQDAEHREPLGKLAQREKISSYAYKAEKLGFNWGDAGNYRKFAEKTLLGQWLRAVGVEVLPENQAAIAEILKILCNETLKWVKQQDGAAD